jgi:ElaB/YqjD/DUF883 family membrane-anchored ribosome-binding protein
MKAKLGVRKMTSENTTTYREGASSTPDKLADATSQMKSKASELARAASDKIDENRDAAACGLKSAASTLHEKAESLPGGEKVAKFTHTTADKLSAASDYIREHDVNSMMADVERLVKNNPGPALLGAAVIGFVVARTLSSSD